MTRRCRTRRSAGSTFAERPVRRLVWPAAGAVALLLSGCSGSLRTQPHATAHKTVSICASETKSAIARALDANTVSAKRSVGGNGMPQCAFLAHRHAGAVSVLVNVDSGPQAPFRLERTVVEATQLFGPAPPGWEAPIGVRGLGAYASWFARQDELMASNNVDLLTVSVNWPHEPRAGMIRLARMAIAPYMRDGRHLPGNAHTGYPG